MHFPDEVVGDTLARLRRVEGQVRGIQRMLDEERECSEVVAQLSAASRALDRVRVRLLASGLRYCTEQPREAASRGLSVAEFERLLLSLR